MSPRRVVIVGMGVVTPIGVGLDTFWRACLSGTSAVAPTPAHWADYYAASSSLWAPLPEIDFLTSNVNRIERMQLDLATVIGLCACKEALTGARLDIRQKDEKKNTFAIEGLRNERCGVYMGTGIAGISSFAWNQAHHCFAPVREHLGPESRAEKLLRMPSRFNPFAVSQIMPNATAAAIGIKYSLCGPNTTYTNACAAGTVAVGNAFRAVRDGGCDVAVCGGVEHLGDEFGGIFHGFDLAKTLVRNCEIASEANRPFDKRRSGFLFAEGGGAVLIVESLDHARARGADVIAEIVSYAESFDAYSMMAVDPSAGTIRAMIDQALESAELQPADVDYVNAHATGTMLNDDVEARFIDETFGSKPLVNATKSLIGHTIGAAGAIETVVTALTLRDQTTHICKNLEDPVRDLNFVTAAKPFDIRTGLTHSFAFGGHNAALVLKRFS